MQKNNLYACVGFTNSEMDAGILLEVIEKSEINCFNIDIIDLMNGRDFLKEVREYDIVILDYIFKWRHEELDRFDKIISSFVEGCRVSELHSPENWRRRLITSKAKKIYVFGNSNCDSEVSGEWIGEIEGYTMKYNSDTLGNAVWSYELI